MRPRRAIRAAFAVVIAVAAVTVAGDRVLAHAQLIDVTPADGELLERQPPAVVLTFTEPVSLEGGSVRVLDDDATDVSVGVTMDNGTITVALAPGLAEGTYTVAWQVVSADSHPIGGASVFHVGRATSSGLTGAALGVGAGGAGWGVRAGAVALSAVGYCGTMIAAGTLYFRRYAGGFHGLSALTGRAGVLGAVAVVASVPLRIARLGGGLDALRDDGVLTSALRGPIGVSTAVTALALFAVAALVDRPAPWWLPAATATAALAGFTIEGHTRSNEPRWAMLGSDLVHLSAGALWLGGIVALILAFRAALTPESLATAVRRFSSVALVAVAVVAATGTVMAWIILPGRDELTVTGYGLALLTKVASVVVLVGLGAFNRFRLVPALGRRDDGATTGIGDDGEASLRWLRRIVVAELVVLAGVVAVTAVMVTRSPLRAVAAAPAVLPGPSAGIDLSDSLTAEVTTTPGRVGFNVVDVVLRDAQGRLVNPFEAPVVELALPALDVGPLRPDVLAVAIGRYQATLDLGFAGDWELFVRVRAGEFESVAGSTIMTIGE